MRYLLKRGITEDSIKRFKLGYGEWKGQDWLTIPSFESGKVKLLKYRKLEPDNRPDLKKYEREPGGKSILFNCDALNENNEIVICEGEIDTITLIQNGYENVVGTTAGTNLLNEWYDDLILKDKIFLIFDGDEAGQESAKNVWSTRLGIGKCWNILLPKGEDINSYFTKYTVEDFNVLIKNSKQFRVEGIVSLKETLFAMYRRFKDKGHEEVFELPWPSINKLLGGGLMRKRLAVVGGKPGVGKTSWAIQICDHFAVKYKMPVLYFCLEMPEVSLATKIVQLHRNLTLQEIDYSDALIYAMDIEDLPIYFGYTSKITPDIFYNTMKEVRNRYGVQFGVFDNLQRMIRTGEEADMGRASGIFKDITMDLDIPFLLVSQPRKLSSGAMPTYEDFKGSSAIPADADYTIIMHRKLELQQEGVEALSPITKILVDKSRFSSGGLTHLTFDGSRSRFYEEKK